MNIETFSEYCVGSEKRPHTKGHKITKEQGKVALRSTGRALATDETPEKVAENRSPSDEAKLRRPARSQVQPTTAGRHLERELNVTKSTKEKGYILSLWSW